MKPEDDLSSRMRDLTARIDRFEQAEAQKTVVRAPPEPPAAVSISPLEKAIRRWTLALFIVWGLFVYGWMVVATWGQKSAWELIGLLCFALLSALFSYGLLFFFYVELGKSIWRKLRNRSDRD
jgi:hypothetical protein